MDSERPETMDDLAARAAQWPQREQAAAQELGGALDAVDALCDAAGLPAPLDLEAIRAEHRVATHVASSDALPGIAWIRNALGRVPALLEEMERLRGLLAGLESEVERRDATLHASRIECSGVESQRDACRQRIAELVAERERLREALAGLVSAYVRNRGTAFEFVTMRSESGIPAHWRKALAALAPAPAPVARCRCGHDRDAHYDMQSGPCNVVDCGCRDFAPAPAEEVERG